MKIALLAMLALFLVLSLPDPGKTEVRHSTQRHHHASGSPVSTPQNQPSPVSTPAETRSYTYNYYYPEKPTVSIVWFQTITTVLLLLFTGGLWITSIWQWRAIERQATLMQAQFDQWIELTNWRCVGKPRDNKLKIMVDLTNPTGFPITLTGNLTGGEEEWPADNEFFSPSSPRSIEFKISITNDQWDVHPPVTAHFTYPDRITKTPILWDC
jgi:hypothetical protein